MVEDKPGGYIARNIVNLDQKEHYTWHNVPLETIPIDG